MERLKLTGRRALVTGANSGVGLELTKRLLKEGAEVVALVRSDFETGDEPIATARETGRLSVYRADLGDYKSLKAALDAIKSSGLTIDFLFNNAGAAFREIKRSPQGNEAHFEINTVAPYIILRELKDLVAKSESKTIVNVSSNAQLFVPDFSAGLLEKPVGYKPIIGPYGASKLALSLWTKLAADELAREGIGLRSVCPGPNRTKMTSAPSALPWFIKILQKFVMKSPDTGAARVYGAAFDPPADEPGIFINKGKKAKLRFFETAGEVYALVDRMYREGYLKI